MKMKILAAGFAVLMSCSVWAGDWHYGCVGHLPYGQKIEFNRGTLVIESGEMNRSNLIGLTDDSIEVFTTTDGNSGFVQTLTFQSSWSADDKVTLTEKSSRKLGATSEESACTGNRAREITHETTRRVYEVTLPREDKPLTIPMDCWEYIVSACG